MRLIDEHNAEDYLRETSRVASGQKVRIRELTGGVSNMVLLIEPDGAPAFVLKQARAQLRTQREWFSSVERIWREADVLAICARLLEPASFDSGWAEYETRGIVARTPRILFEDRENYLLAISAAPRPNTVWKAELLAGRADPAIAAACGTLLATLHGKSWRDEAIAERIGDRTLFDQLRVDPYYRTLAATCGETRPAVERVIASLEKNSLSLVHADFSPKNLLVFADGLMMVDFETGHFGDPAFDLGFFLSHLVLKACLKIPQHAAYLELTAAFRAAYDASLRTKIPPAELAELWARGVQNFALCARARLDGKSPVEYLTDESRRTLIRTLCRRVLETEPGTWPDVLALTTTLFNTT